MGGGSLCGKSFDLRSHTGLTAGCSVPVDDALCYCFIKNALSLIQLRCCKLDIFMLYCVKELLDRVLAARFPEAVVYTVSLRDQNSFLC